MEGHELRRVRAQDLLELSRRPGVEAALLALGVRVDGRDERALGRGHVAQEEVGRAARHPGQLAPPRHLPGLGVGHRQQRVVVEHLLEVWDEPFRVGRVAVEAAPHLVLEAPGGHPLQGEHRHVQRPRVARPAVVAQEEAHREARRELGGALQPPVALVEGAGEELDRPGNGLGPRHGLGRHARAAQRGAHGLARLQQPIALLGQAPAHELPAF